MTEPENLRAQAERCRLVGLRYGGLHRDQMQLLADQLEAEAQALEQNSASAEAWPPREGLGT